MLKKNKQKVAFILIFFILINILPIKNVKASINGSNIIKNGNFEESFNYWGKSVGEDELKIDLNYDETNNNTSAYFLNSSNKNIYGVLAQKVDISNLKGDFIKLSYSLKEENFSGEFQIRVSYLDASGNQVDKEAKNIIYLKGQESWYEKTSLISIPDNDEITTAKISFIYYYCTGNILLDNISAEVVQDSESDKLVKNGSFENDFGFWEKYSSNSDFTININEDYAEDGQQSLVFRNNTNNKYIGYIEQNIKLPEYNNKYLELKFLTKSINFSGSFQVRATYYNEAGNIVGSEFIKEVNLDENSDSALKNVNLEIPKDDNVYNMRIRFLCSSISGELYMDNISLELLDDPDTTRILKNGDFEKGIDVWGRYSSNNNLILDLNDDIKDGNYSFKFTNSSETKCTGNLYQTVNLSGYEGKDIKLNYWIKKENFLGEFQIRVTYYDAEKNVIGDINKYITSIKLENEWHEKSAIIKIPEDTSITSANISFIYNNSIGNICLDDISLELVEDTEKGLMLKNGSFENDFGSWNKYSSNSNLDVDLSSDTYMNGENSLMFNNISKENCISSVSQKVLLKNIYNNKQMNISFGEKYENFSGIFQVRARYYDEKGNLLSENKKNIELGSGVDWYEKKAKLEIPNNINIEFVELSFICNSNAGILYIDDINVEIADNEEAFKIIKNGSFEDGYISWGRYSKDDYLEVAITNESYNNGEYSMKFTNTSLNKGFGNVSQEIDVSQAIGKSLHLINYLKTVDFDGEYMITAKFYDENKTVIGELFKNSIELLNNSDWYLQESEISVPNNEKIKTAEITLIYYNSKGTLYLDDVSIEIVDDIDAINIIKNPDFENYLANWNRYSNNDNISIKLDSNEKKSGLNSIKFNNPLVAPSVAPIIGTIDQKIDLSNINGNTLLIKEWIKTSNFNGDFKIVVTFYNELGNTIMEDEKILSIPSDLNDWILKQNKIEIPKNTTSAQVKYVYYNAEGTLYIDNISSDIVLSDENSIILKNGDFEEDFSYWKRENESEDFAIDIDENNSKNGKNSIHLYSKGQNPVKGIISQKADIKSEYIGKTLNLSQWVKASNLMGESIRVRIRFFDSEDSEVCFRVMSSLGIKSNCDWNLSNFNIKVPDNSNIKYITLEYIYDNCQGELWLDDIGFKVIDGEFNNNLILNGGFETNISDNFNNWKLFKQDENLDYSIDNVYKAEGMNSLKVTSKSINKESRIINYIDISQDMLNNYIKVYQQIMSDSYGKVSILVDYLDENNNRVSEPTTWTIIATKEKEWEESFNKVFIPSNSKIKKLAIEYRTSELLGNLWIDDIKVEPYIAIKDINCGTDMINLSTGESKKLDINITPSNATYKNITIKSDDENIVKVDESNNIIAVNNGITKIIIKENYDNTIFEIPVLIGQDNLVLEKNTNLSGKQGECIEGKVKVSSSNTDLSYSIFTEGNTGFINLNNDGSFKYYINDDANEYGEFSIKVEDKQGNQGLAKYSLVIEEKEDDIYTDDFTITLDENTIAEGAFKIKSNSDIVYSKDNEAKNGNFTIDKDGKYSYKPNENFTGYDNVKIKVETNKGNVKIVNCIIYVAPNKESLYNMLLNQVKSGAIISEEDFLKIKDLIKSDTVAEEYYLSIKRRADKTLDSTVSEAGTGENGVTRLSSSAKSIIQEMSFLYKITGDEKYAERAMLEVNNIIKYDNWNTYTYLDVGEFALALSFAYDWLDDYLTDSQKKKIEDNIIEKALKFEQEDYLKGSRWFDKYESNFGIVYHSDIMFACLVIANSDNKDTTLQVFNNSLKIINNLLNLYYKDGATVEGPGYWSYATENLMYIYTAMQKILNIQKPFSEVLDFDKIQDFIFYINGDVSQFNYGDATEGDITNGYISMWLAKINNSPYMNNYAKWCFNKIGYGLIFNLIWYDPDTYNADNNLDLDKYYPQKQVVSMRSDFGEQGSTYVGFKGGSTGKTHTDLDIGTFVYDALGVRWALDLGSENYSLDNIGETEKLGGRWKYYRKKAEGHNTLVIGKSLNEDQVIDSLSEVKKIDLNSDNPYVILDMTSAYSDRAANVERKLQLLNRKDLLIEDSFTLKKQEDIMWQMHTKADIKIIDNTTAILSIGEKEMKVSLISDCNAKFEIQEAVPQEGSTKVSTQNSNDGIRKLVAKSNVKSGKISVLMKPTDNLQESDELVIESLKPDKQSPQNVGSTVTLTAQANGGKGILEYKYYKYLNGKYSLIKDWSTNSSIQIAPSTAGKYDIYVAVKDESGNIVRKNVIFEFKNQENLSISSFIANKTSPQKVKTAVTFTTKVSGVTGIVQYKYYRYLNGKYGLIKDWSSNSSIQIAPSTAGQYDIYVAVKDESGNTVRKNVVFEFENQENLAISSFTANKTSPQAVKTVVTFTAKASGVTGTIQYKYYRYLNGNYGLIKDWSSNSSIQIAPSTAGTYDIYVAVKDTSGNIVRKNIKFVFR
ncbi:MAG: heparinase II/III family protein [Clostridium sp.]